MTAFIFYLIWSCFKDYSMGADSNYLRYKKNFNKKALKFNYEVFISLAYEKNQFEGSFL